MFRVLLIGFALASLLGCTAQATTGGSAPVVQQAVPTVEPTQATVTDVSVPLEATESDALRPHGFMGQGAYGRLDRGCTVDVLKITDRAAMVDVSRCQTIDGVGPQKGLRGWVAKSALSLT